MLKTPFNERWGAFSPDGRWVAYESNESGRNEIYVRALLYTARVKENLGKLFGVTLSP